MKKKECDV